MHTACTSTGSDDVGTSDDKLHKTMTLNESAHIECHCHKAAGTFHASRTSKELLLLKPSLKASFNIKFCMNAPSVDAISMIL